MRYLGSVLFSALVFLAGCSEDEIINTPDPELGYNEGDIIFGARGGYENNNSNSRTIYTGETYTVGGKTFEQVDWIDGDQIAVYSPEALNNGGTEKWAEYKVTTRQTGTHNEHFASFAPAGPARLQWKGDGIHHFYAAYPSPGQNYSVKFTPNQSGVEVTGIIPVTQNPIRIDKDQKGNWIARPQMKNAYMTAVASATQADGSVNLTFKSIVTAIEVELRGASNTVELLNVFLREKTKARNLTGGFVAELKAGDTQFYPTTRDESADIQSQVSIPLSFKGTDGKLRGLKIGQEADCKSLKVTFFVHPFKDLNDLELGIQGVSANGRTGIKYHDITSGGSSVMFEAHKKHYIKNVTIPAEYDANNWMKYIPNKAMLSQLSIPGSYGSYTSGASDPNYKTQTISVAEQWAMGIRCFEVTTSNDGQTIVAGVNMGVGQTLSGAVSAINQSLTEHPEECAIILVRFQPGDRAKQRDFINGVMNTVKLYKENVVRYSPDLSMEEVRGKLMFILAPSSDGEDKIVLSQSEEAKYEKVVLVEGCGSLHDKWKQRGYPVKDSNPNDVANGNCGNSDPEGSYEQYMIISSKDTPATTAFKLLKKGEPNYFYKTYGGDKTHSIWVQEWNRVADRNIIVKVQDVWGPDLWAYWKESYSEKLADAQLTFDKAIENGKGANNIIFINSLGGYLIDETNSKSYEPCYKGSFKGLLYDSWGGSYGDYAGLSNKLNPDMYEYIVQKWNKQNSGPMGIVLIGRLKEMQNGQYVPGSVEIPQIVVSNNFTFPMKGKDGTVVK